MLRIILGFPFLLFLSNLLAVEEEAPVETNTTGIVAFLLISAACLGLYVWLTWRSSKKKEEERQGETF
jgi:hypothetical protein